MNLRKTSIIARRFLRQSRLAQVLLLVGIWGLGEATVRLAHLPFPGGVVGLFIILGGLSLKMIKPTYLRLGAEWLLAEMMLFFVPAVPAVMAHPEFFGWLGIKLLLIILVGTTLVMLATALTVETYLRHTNSRSAGAPSP